MVTQCSGPHSGMTQRHAGEDSACLDDEKLPSASSHFGDTVCGSQKVGTGKRSEELYSPVETDRKGVKVDVFLDTGIGQAEFVASLHLA